MDLNLDNDISANMIRLINDLLLPYFLRPWRRRINHIRRVRYRKSSHEIQTLI